MRCSDAYTRSIINMDTKFHELGHALQYGAQELVLGEGR
jgi:hypothetical protein